MAMEKKDSSASRQALQDTAAAVRQRLRAARQALSTVQQATASEAIRAHVQAGLGGTIIGCTVAGFWPLGGEPDLRPLLMAWAQTGVTVALPVVIQRAAPLQFLAWTPDAPMRTGAYGIAEPAPGPACLPDVVLVPMLGYTLQGERVGYGGGYYDRTIAAWRAAGHTVRTIGIAWGASRLAPGEYAFAPHDMTLDAVVDETGWHTAR